MRKKIRLFRIIMSIFRPNGTVMHDSPFVKIWGINGIQHRLDGPAVVRSDGDREWWVNGKRHRVDGPAVIWSNGTEEWWHKGNRHRVDGPAVIEPSGHTEWWHKGKQHRVDGPAVIKPSGTKEWWIDDIEYQTMSGWLEELQLNYKITDLEITELILRHN